jgi:hypothetical protein
MLWILGVGNNSPLHKLIELGEGGRGWIKMGGVRNKEGEKTKEFWTNEGWMNGVVCYLKYREAVVSVSACVLYVSD